MKIKTIKHHLSDEVLAAYSAGTLPEAFSLVVASHASLCDDCRAAIAGFDTVGGAVLEQAGSAKLAPNALAQMMALIQSSNADTEAPKAKAAASIFPTPLAEYVGGGPDHVRWRRVGAGVKQAILPSKGVGSARLLYIPPGTAMPSHSHRGLELTMVLQGAFSDEIDRFARGDVEMGDDDLSRKPVAEIGEACICLAATEAPLKFNGFVPRILQPFFGI